MVDNLLLVRVLPHTPMLSLSELCCSWNVTYFPLRTLVSERLALTPPAKAHTWQRPIQTTPVLTGKSSGNSRHCDSPTEVCWCLFSYGFIPTKHGLVSDLTLDPSITPLFLRCVWGHLILDPRPFCGGEEKGRGERDNRNFKLFQCSPTGPLPATMPTHSALVISSPEFPWI